MVFLYIHRYGYFGVASGHLEMMTASRTQLGLIWLCFDLLVLCDLFLFFILFIFGQGCLVFDLCMDGHILVYYSF